jgi:hypothetical protein
MPIVHSRREFVAGLSPEPMEASDERVDSWSLRNRPKEQPDGQRADAGAGHGAGS